MAYSMYAFKPESKPLNFIAEPHTRNIFKYKKDVSHFKIPYIAPILTTCALLPTVENNCFQKN